MAASSYQQHHHQPFLLDTGYLSNTPIEIPLRNEEMATNASSSFQYFFAHDPMAEIIDARPHESCGSHNSSSTTKTSDGEKKRKSRDATCLSSIQSKESKSRSKKKPSGVLLKEVDHEEKTKKERKKTCEEPPEGYIHVRARRGQATDSHSLAERVRREKISARMKLLQGLVPGCDKVTGKALMLDEIINYVQSLQNQVEFLSMKLASLNPILYNLGVDFDDNVNLLEKLEGGQSQPLPTVHPTNHTQLTAFEEATNNYRMMEASAPFLLHGEGPTAFSQDNGSSLMQVGGQSPQGGFLTQLLSNSMLSFH